MKSSRILLILTLLSSLTLTFNFANIANAESDYVIDTGWLIKPSTGGYATETYCPTNMAAVGITISTILEQSRPYLQDFRIKCLDTPMPAKGKSYSPVTKTFVSQSPGNSYIRDEYCPSGSVLIGLKMSTKSYVRDIAPVCALPETGELTLNSDVGSGTGESVALSSFASVPQTSICPVVGVRQSYVIGVDGFAASGVDAIRVLCGFTLKGPSSQNLPVGEILLAQYLPRGRISASGSLAASSTTKYVNFSALTQVGGDGTSNTNSLPFRTSTTTNPDPKHYFQFVVTPASSNVALKITRITYSSFSYPIGSGPVDNLISGKPANQFGVNFLQRGSARTIPSSIGLVNIDFKLEDFPGISKSTPIEVGLFGGSGVQYNDLSGGDGATGMRIFGKLIDNSPTTIDTPEPPQAPTNFTFSLAKNVVLIAVDIPKSLLATATVANFLLTSAELGFPSNNQAKASSISNGKAYFKFKVNSDLFGKTVALRINSFKEGVESSSLSTTISVPKLSSSPSAVTPTVKATVKSTPRPVVKTIRCFKAGVTRTFTASSCPPGYSSK